MNTLDSFRLDHTRALITGASRGIGRAVALAFAQAGAQLALSARSEQALKATAEQVAALGASAVLVPGDLAVPDEPGWVVDEAARLLGGLDVVVHNAGILPSLPDGTPLLTPLQLLPQQAWDEVLAVNLNATAALCRHAHRHLATSAASAASAASGEARGTTRDTASLVLMSSLAGVIGTPMMEAYAASKAAQISLARSLAVGWARQGIRVNALCPGWTRTDMTAFAHTNGPLSDWLLAHVPLGRWADPEEVAAAALFLASPAAGYLTGQALLLDGGVSVPDGGLSGIPKPPSPFGPA